jgi:hypothetical protein
MKRTIIHGILLLLLLNVPSCDIMDSSVENNLEDVQISDVLSEPGTDSAIVRFTTNIPARSRIEYGTASGAYTLDSGLTTSATTSHSFTLSSLASDTTYYGRAYSETDDGKNASSDEFSFTTSSTITVTNLTFTPDTLSSGNITWTTNVATTDLVEYGTVSGVYTESTLQSDTASTSHNISLSGLTSNTTYYYRVRNFHATLGNTVSSQQNFSITETAPTTAQKRRGIWLVGGLRAQSITTSTNTCSTIDLYDPVTNNWYSDVATVPTPVSFAAVVAYQGQIFILGGFTNTGIGAVTGLVQIYDVANGTWDTGAPMPNARANHSAVVINGAIYVLRGTTGTYNTGWLVTGAPTNALLYYIASDSWAPTGTLIADSAYSNKPAVAYTDVIYYLGGKTNNTTGLSALTEGFSTSYNLVTTVTEVGLPAARVGMSAVLYTEPSGIVNIFVIGGFSALNSTQCYLFNTLAATTTATNLFQSLRYPFSTAPSSWTTYTLDNLPASLAFGSAIISGTTLYHFGGALYSAPSTVSAQSVVYTYNLGTFPSGLWASLGAVMPQPRFGHTAVIAY